MTIVLTDKQIARFWSKVDRKGIEDCWSWLGSKREHGYGYFKVNNRRIPAHRISFLITNGYLTEGLYMLHRCDNPECTNPAHLWEGTIKDNVDDREAKGRWAGGTKGKHLTESEVVEVKLMLQAGYSHVEIAKKFSKTRHHIQQISVGDYWADIDISHIRPLALVNRDKYQKRGAGIGTAKLTDVQVKYIKEELNKGVPRSTLAQLFNVCTGCIDAIAQERTWAHIKV